MKRIIKILSVLLCLVLLPIIAHIFKFIPFALDKADVAKFYLANGASDTGAANLVTAVILGFRGFDTLGEVLVLFCASLGVGIILGEGEMIKAKSTKTAPSFILRKMTDLLFPLIVLFGIYIIMHGHLTPGGGFQGGAVLASGFLLFYLADKHKFNFGIVDAAESLSGLGFVVLGIVGLVVFGVFLINFLPFGVLTKLFSAGFIPILYTFIGIKVGSELSAILYRMMK